MTACILALVLGVLVGAPIGAALRSRLRPRNEFRPLLDELAALRRARPR